MAVRKLSSGRYAVEFEAGGHRVFRRLKPSATKAQADAYEVKLRRELIDQDTLGKFPVVSLHKAISDWGKISGNPKADLILGVVGDLTLTRAGMVEASKRILAMPRTKKGTKGPIKVATHNRRLAALKGAAKWAWKVQHWTQENLSPYVVMLDKKQETVRYNTYPESRIQKMIVRAPDPETRAYIALGCYGLMRAGEIMRAQPEHVVPGGLKILKTKSGIPRVVPIPAGIRPILKSALPLKTHVRTLYERFCGVRDSLGLSGVHHDLRRSGATILLNADVPLEIVADILGDSLEVARKHYAHVLHKTAARAVRKGFKPIRIPSGKARKGVGPPGFEPGTKGL